MTVLIDSWAWIEYWKGGKSSKAAAEYIDGEEEAYVSAINLLETYAWVARYYGEGVAKSKLETVERRCFTIPVDKITSIEAAKLKLKHKLGIADSVLLATARSLSAKIVTGDTDFRKMDDVIFIG
jgi:predicted nucleic acid-binding protein